MPVYYEPTPAQQDFNGNVSFSTRGKKNVFAVAIFLPPLVATDTYDTPAEVEFTYFSGHANLNASVNFLYNEAISNTPAYITFTLPSSASFPASVNFPSTHSLSASVNFIQEATFNCSAQVDFFYPGHTDFAAHVTFPSIHSLNATVTFVQKAHSDFHANVTFQTYASSTVLDAHVAFPYHSDFDASVNFSTTSDFHASVFIIPTFDLQAGVNFVYTHDLSASVYFAYASEATFNANVTFVHTHDTPGNVTFPHAYSLTAHSAFSAEDELNLPASVNLYQHTNFPAHVLFQIATILNLQAFVFLGSFQTSLNARVSFTQITHNDFNAAIQIQQAAVRKTGNFTNNSSFPAYIQILSHVTLPASVVFSVPPFDIDTPASVSFTQFAQQDVPAQVQITRPPFDLPADVLFSCFNYTNFRAAITINNAALGAGNIIVVAEPDATTSQKTMPIPDLNAPTPAVNQNTIQTMTDASGFFELLNLQPGVYTVTPIYPGLSFIPANFVVTITNANVQLYFNASGALVNQVKTNSVVPANTGADCFIENPQGNAGTFSIEGFISLVNIQYQNLFTIVSDENIATNFRETLDN